LKPIFDNHIERSASCEWPWSGFRRPGTLRNKLIERTGFPVIKARPHFTHEHTMRKILRGYAKDKNGNLILVGAMPIPFSEDKCPPATRREKRHLVRQGATVFKKETIR